MSEINELNSGDSMPGDVEHLLGGLTPAALELNREDLFFRAGVAAGKRSRGLSLIWPSVAAALVVLCIGLAADLVLQCSGPNVEIVANRPSHEMPPAFESSHSYLREWQRWSSLERLPPGELTAMGWIETPSQLRTERQKPDSKTNSPPRQAPIYYEMLREFQEG